MTKYQKIFSCLKNGGKLERNEEITDVKGDLASPAPETPPAESQSPAGRGD